MHISVNKLVLASLLFISSIGMGTTGYVIIEDYSWNDAFYMAVITFSTVGFTEVNPLSSEGKIFTALYISFNLGVFAYTASVISSFLFEGELRKVFKRYIVSREVKRMNEHIIVCGFGKNGERACHEFHKARRQFVVIEADLEVIESFSNENKYQFINGNATLDEVLLDAGLERAHTIITTLPSDADNVFITLTAKEINPDINIIAKASEANSEKKLHRAGASHVVMPDRLGGMHMANLITKPYVIEFIKVLSGISDSKLELTEVSHAALKPGFHEKTLAELDIRNKTGAYIIAYKDIKEGFIFNPHSEKKINKDDVLIVIGNENQLQKFNEHFVG